MSQPDTRDAVCYVQRRLITRWKRMVLQGKSPLFIYGSNDDRVFSDLKKNDNLWIISSIPQRPPELVAHFIIEIVAPFGDSKLGKFKKRLKPFNIYKYIAIGTNESRFFGHNDVSYALLNSIYSSSLGKPRILTEDKSKWQSHLGKKFQRPALIYNMGEVFNQQVSPGASLFEKVESQLNHAVFISYKWNDHPRSLVRSLAYKISGNNFMVWLDQLALPVSGDARQRKADNTRLKVLLKYGFQQSKAFMAIDSKNYGKATKNSKKADNENWTLIEWKGKLDPNKNRKRFVFLLGQEITSEIIRNTKTNKVRINQNTLIDHLRSMK